MLTQLNLVRMEDLGYHTRVLPLETALRNLNDQQGLGIVLGFSGIVLDVRLLKQIGLALGPFVVSAVPDFLSLYHARMEWHWRG